MFVDTAKVFVAAGDGGDGVVSFRHEKFVDRGGPDGGDGGNGGSVILQASDSENTLANFRYQKELKAEDGKPGEKVKRHGKSGADLIIKVPVGTVAVTEDGRTVADLTVKDQQVVIAKGGRGGFGNAHFKSSVRQAPRIAEKGDPGDKLDLSLELKMIADVGLVGLPNAGKSTLLSKISNAKPEVANYPFTTLRPHLGVVDVDDQSLLFADIPGLIEGASSGKGLGDEFLRHIERTKVIVHLIDAWQDDLAAAYKTIQNELKAYKVDMSKKKQLVALTKIEGLDDEMIASAKHQLTDVLPKNSDVFAISAHSGQGVKELLRAVAKLVKQNAKTQKAEPQELPVITLAEQDEPWVVQKTEDGFLVTGSKIERFAKRTNFDNPEAVSRLRVIMTRLGITKELEKLGAKPGDKVRVGSFGLKV